MVPQDDPLGRLAGQLYRAAQTAARLWKECHEEEVVEDEDERPFPTPHPRFAAHFTDPLYYDEGEELAPFGSDEGSDTLYNWIDRRDQVDDSTTVRWLLEQDMPGFFGHPEWSGTDVDAFVIAAGFTLILLTGRIDREGKDLALNALRRALADFGDFDRDGADEDDLGGLEVMIRDLEAFSADS